MIEYISSEHSDVWQILTRTEYSEEEARDIERMYDVMVTLSKVAGTKVMQFIELYDTVYHREFVEIAHRLSDSK